MEQQPMTMAERQKMFAKDYLDRFDLGKLIGVSPCEASVFIQEIKRCTRDRLHRRGKSMCRIISITMALTLGTTTICYPKRRKNMEQKNLTPEETERILSDFDKKREVLK